MAHLTVIGGTGNVGRHLLAALAATSAEVSAPGHAEADLTDPSSLAPALKGADALFLMVPGDGAGVDPAAILSVADVRRVVLLSSQLVGTRAGAHPHLRAFEEALAASDVESVVLRPGGFASNSFAWASSVRDARAVHAPFGGVALPVIDPADIAACAAAALLGDGEGTFELTGPAPVTPREQAAAIGAAIGAEVGFHELTRAEARAQLTAFMPPTVADDTLDILGSPTPAEQRPATGVADLLNRPATPFAAWAARNADAFR